MIKNLLKDQKYIYSLNKNDLKHSKSDLKISFYYNFSYEFYDSIKLKSLRGYRNHQTMIKK